MRTYPRSKRPIPHGPNAGPPNSTVGAAPGRALVLCQRTTASVTTARTTPNVWRIPSAAGRARPARGRQAPEPPLLLAAFAAAHALFFLLNKPSESKADGHAARHARVAAKPGRFSPQATNLAFSVTFALLNLLLAERLHLWLPRFGQLLRIVPPARARSAVALERVVGELGDDAADARGSTGRCERGRAPARHQTARFAGFLLEAQDGLVDGVRHGGHPLAVQAQVGACLARKGFRGSGRVQQRPLEFVRVHL